MDYKISFIAGCNSGIASFLLCQPFDFIKVQQQAFKDKYKNSIDCFLKITRKQGFLALFRGGSMPLIAQMFEGSLVFGIIDFMKTKLQVKSDICMASIFCYFVAGAVDGVMMAPFELIKIRRQIQSKSQSEKFGTTDIIKEIYKEKGPLGLFRGCSSTVIKESFGAIIYFFSYYYSMHLFEKYNPKKDEKIKLFDSLISGSIAGMTYWLAIYPVDTIKTIIQSHNKNIPNLFDYSKRIIQKYGIKRLYLGVGPVLFRSIPSNAVYFLAYEGTKDLIQNKLINE